MAASWSGFVSLPPASIIHTGSKRNADLVVLLKSKWTICTTEDHLDQITKLLSFITVKRAFLR